MIVLSILNTEIRILILKEASTDVALIETELLKVDVPFISKTVQIRDDFIRELHDTISCKLSPEAERSDYYG